jgi:sporulation protein YlmC with PRC-barrel domain
MKRVEILSLMVALGAIGAAGAQTSNTAEQTPTPGTTNSAPATSRTEGTAADRTPPGATPTREVDPGTVNPVPATSRAEGTAADRSPPEETPVRGTAASQASEQVTTRMAAGSQNKMQQDRRGSKLIGTAVRDSQGETLGEVKDIIVDPQTGTITHAVIAQSGADSAQLLAVPWKTLQPMMREGWVTIDQARLKQAPAFESGQWPNLSNNDWSTEADRYWRANQAEGAAKR